MGHRLNILSVAIMVLVSGTLEASGIFFPSSDTPPEVQRAFATTAKQFAARGDILFTTEESFAGRFPTVRATSSEAGRMFYADVKRQLNGRLPHVIDSFTSFTVEISGKMYQLSQNILEHFTTDHHGPNFQPGDYRTNSTMKLVSKFKGMGPDAFQQMLYWVTTDNLADAVDGIFLGKHARSFANNPRLLDLFAETAEYEDFGLFGSANTESPEARQLAKATLHLYDNALKRFSVFDGADRIGHLSNGAQRAIVNQLLLDLEKLWFNEIGKLEVQRDYVTDLANAFERQVQQSISLYRPSYQKHMSYLDSTGELDLASKIIVIEDVPMTATTPGRFASWGADNRLHETAPIVMKLTKRPDGKVQTIIALADGRALDGDLRPLVEQLQAIGVAILSRGERLLYDFAGSKVNIESILDVMKVNLLDPSRASVLLGPEFQEADNGSLLCTKAQQVALSSSR